MSIRNRLAAAMREARQDKEWSQADLAEKVSASLESISNIERSRQSPSIELFALIVEVLELDPREILSEPDQLLTEERLRLEARLRRVGTPLSDERLSALLKIAGILAKLDKE